MHPSNVMWTGESYKNECVSSGKRDDTETEWERQTKSGRETGKRQQSFRVDRSDCAKHTYCESVMND